MALGSFRGSTADAHKACGLNGWIVDSAARSPERASATWAAASIAFAGASGLYGKRRQWSWLRHALGIHQMFHAVGFGDDYDSLIGDGEAAGAVFFRVEADVNAGRNCHSLIDDGVADGGSFTSLSMIARRTRQYRPTSTPSNRIEPSTWA